MYINIYVYIHMVKVNKSSALPSDMCKHTYTYIHVYMHTCVHKDIQTSFGSGVVVSEIIVLLCMWCLLSCLGELWLDSRLGISYLP